MNELSYRCCGFCGLFDPIKIRIQPFTKVSCGSGIIKDKCRCTLHELFNGEFGEGADKPFVDQTYDATFLTLLAIEKAGSTDRAAMAQALRDVASAPGEKVGPGEWEKAKALLAEGKDIDYDGAGGNYDFDENGDVVGYIGKFVVDGDAYKQTGIMQ